MQIPHDELRGLGIHVSELEFEGFGSSGSTRRIESFLNKRDGGDRVGRDNRVPTEVLPTKEAEDRKPSELKETLPEGWDKSVFEALPSTLREEILREHVSRSRRDEARKAQRERQKKALGGIRQRTLAKVGGQPVSNGKTTCILEEKKANPRCFSIWKFVQLPPSSILSRR